MLTCSATRQKFSNKIFSLCMFYSPKISLTVVKIHPNFCLARINFISTVFHSWENMGVHLCRFNDPKASRGGNGELCRININLHKFHLWEYLSWRVNIIHMLKYLLWHWKFLLDLGALMCFYVVSTKGFYAELWKCFWYEYKF